MKKIIALILCLFCICASFAGCAENNVVSKENATADETKAQESKEVNVDKYDKNYDGFCKYLVDAKIATGDPTEMEAKLIGAEKGKRYVASINKKAIIIELYSYPKDKSNDISKNVISQVEEKGEFLLEDLYTVPIKAVLSGNKDILLIYSDKNIDADENKKNYENFLETFSKF